MTAPAAVPMKPAALDALAAGAPGALWAAPGARLEGEVRFDEVSRLLYSTDASVYQIMPVGVVIPRHAGDVAEAVKRAAARGVPLLPRGSGTSPGGQTVGAALVLDFSKYMNGILELNAEQRWVRVQPGVILDELNAYPRAARAPAAGGTARVRGALILRPDVDAPRRLV